MGAGCLVSEDQWIISGGTFASMRNKSEIIHSGDSDFQTFAYLPELMSHHTMIRLDEKNVVFIGWHLSSNKSYILNMDTKEFTALPERSMSRDSVQAGKLIFFITFYLQQ